MLVLLAGAACADEPAQVWLAPNLASTDMVELFTRPERWRGARAAVDVFKFYEAQLRADSPAECPDCGGNLFPAFAAVRAFERLAGWGIAVAVETGAVKEWGCSPALTADITREAIERVARAGGRVRYLAMDEPLLAAADCGLRRGEAARQVAGYVGRLRAVDAALEVGDIEPYPHFGAGVLTAWLSDLERAGAKPAFFHVDVDRRLAARRRANVARDLQTLEAWCRLRGIAFGVILWSGESSSDRAFYDDAMAWTKAVHAAVGVPDHSVFQSWTATPEGRRRVPSNLPEADPRAFTLTRLVLDGLLTRPR